MTHLVTKGNMVQRRGFDFGVMTHLVTKGIMVQRRGFDFGLYDSFGHKRYYCTT